MKVVSVKFLLSLALIHVCLADASTNDTKDEEPTVLSDGVMFEDGKVFNKDDIFAKKADSLIKYSAEVMKECNSSECRDYSQCIKVDRDYICLNIRLFNSTNFEELEKPEGLKLHAIRPSGYIFDTDETFFEKANSLLMYSFEAMEECATKECQYYTYCTKVGYDIVCLTIRLDKFSDLLKDLGLEEDPHRTDLLDLDLGYIFDGDDIFAEKSEDLLRYSASIMSTCTKRGCRHYTFCTKVDSDIVCLAVSLSSIDDLKHDEELDSLLYLDDDDDDDHEQEDNNKLLGGKDSEEESEKESKESEGEEEEEEEKQKEDLAEEKEEDPPLA